jgi:membrane glycosyltransferase
MPVQRLFGNPPARREVLTRPHGLMVKRLLLIALTAVLALAASSAVREAFSRDGLDVFDVALLLFFVPLFSWVAFGFVSSTIGFLQLISGAHPGFVPVPSPAASLTKRTAVLMPVYNEDVDAVFARVEAMAYAIAREGGALDRFLRAQRFQPAHGKTSWPPGPNWLPAPIAIYYRRREKNIARKPGNIAEWVRRFGGAYENMLVLDADSVMTGRAIVGLASIMEARPSIGLLQTVPMITNARTLFQRWMQFASEAYGPIARRAAVVVGRGGQFLGPQRHRAHARLAESCGLPDLPGKPPFGGHILSHDMVRSALLRRRGWAVHMVMIGGSYEEYPPTIVDHALRDRRWMQGNLQHLRLLGASGLGHQPAAPADRRLGLSDLAGLAPAADHHDRASGRRGQPHFAGRRALGRAGAHRAAPVRPQGDGTDLDPGRPRTLRLLWRALARGALGLRRTRAVDPVRPGLDGSPDQGAAGPAAGHSLAMEHPEPRGTGHSGPRDPAQVARPPAAGAGLCRHRLPRRRPLWLLPLTLGLFGAPWLISLTSREDLGDAANRIGLFRVPARTMRVGRAEVPEPEENPAIAATA